MAPGQRTDDDESEAITRREALRKGGMAALAAGTFGVLGNSASASRSHGEYGTVIDLGDEGLSSGDVIDPYLDEYFVQGNEVHIPPGEYVWNGGNAGLRSPSRGDAALIGDGNIGDVVFQVEGTLASWHAHDTGEVLVRNITFRGENPEPKAGFTFNLGEDATVVYEHIRAPDGATEPEDRFLFLSTTHEGVAYVRNCYWKGFGNNGAYTDNGRIIFENCVAHNNNISGIRIGTGDSEVYNSLIIVDGEVPNDGQNAINARGIRVREPGDHVIENCDLYYLEGNAPSGSPFELRASETAGVMRNCRIYNATDDPVVHDKSDTSDWTAENVHVSGSGNLEMQGVDEVSVTRGENANPPRTDFEEILGAPIEHGPGTGDDDSGSGRSPSPDDFDHSLVLHASPDNDGDVPEVSLTVTGDATYGDEAESSIDRRTQNDDGTTTLTSVDLDPDGLDSYLFDGDVVDYSVTDGYAVDVSLDGKTMTFAELVGDSSPSHDGSNGALPNTLTVESPSNSGIGSYAVTVSGEVSKVESTGGENSVYEQFEDIARDGKVVGLVHRETDTFRYSGSVTRVTVDGDARLSFGGN